MSRCLVATPVLSKHQSPSQNHKHTTHRYSATHSKTALRSHKKEQKAHLAIEWIEWWKADGRSTHGAADEVDKWKKKKNIGVESTKEHERVDN